jgi:hypothetical protein
MILENSDLLQFHCETTWTWTHHTILRKKFLSGIVVDLFYINNVHNLRHLLKPFTFYQIIVKEVRPRISIVCPWSDQRRWGATIVKGCIHTHIPIPGHRNKREKRCTCLGMDHLDYRCSTFWTKSSMCPGKCLRQRNNDERKRAICSPL